MSHHGCNIEFCSEHGYTGRGRTMTTDPTLAALQAISEAHDQTTETTTALHTQRIQLIRRARPNHTLEEIARAAGISKQRVAQLLERGTR